MKEMRLMQIIGDIDEKYIDEAAPAEQKRKQCASHRGSDMLA